MKKAEITIEFTKREINELYLIFCAISQESRVLDFGEEYEPNYAKFFDKLHGKFIDAYNKIKGGVK